MEKSTQERYFDYILTYANTVSELGEELEEKCKKSRSGDIVLRRKKYMYFATLYGVTLIDKKTTLELTFPFNREEDFIYFEKEDLHRFIESDLNVSGLGKNFSTNKVARIESYHTCLDTILRSGRIQKKDLGYIISTKEIY